MAEPASAQDEEETIRFTRFDASPDVLSREGGILTISIEAETNASQIVVTLDLVEPDGEIQDRSEEHTLVSRSETTVGGEVEIPIRQGSPPGDWRVRVDEVLVGPEGEQTSAQAEGATTSSFTVYRLLPVAGLQSQAWPQFGGDPAHTGRTVAVGPPAIEVVRWRFTPPDDRPLHTPVVGDGRIFAATWGGSLHALDRSGDLAWSETTAVPGGIPYEPALGSQGNLLVPSADGVLQAWTPEGQVDWSHQVGGDGEFRSGPVVGPDGRIFYIRAPWTLVALDETGDRLFATDLPEPNGGIPDQPTVPRSVPSPRIAVDHDRTAVVTAGAGLAVVPPNGTVTAEIDCSCPPRAVGLAPLDDVAFVVGDQEVVGVSLRSETEIWSTDDQPVTDLEGDVWHPPTVDFDGHVYVTSEDGNVHNLTVAGEHLQTIEFLGPLRGQPVVDANGDLYFADACRTLRSIDADLGIRWTKEIDADGCSGLSQSAVLTAGGSIVWPSPAGDLLMLGSNRPPVPAFDVYWDGDEFVFDASASEDPDGSDLTFAWAFGSATDDRGRIVRPDLPALGTVNVTLTVSDGLATVSKTREVSINYPPNPAFTNRTEGFDVLLNATATEDPEGDPVSYNWTVDGVPLSENATLRLPSSGPRVYNVTLTVTDGNLERSLTRTVLTPVRSLWSEHEVALVQGDCPSGVCAVPSSLILTEGSLAEVVLANGAGRTVHAETSFSTVQGSSDRITLDPGERGAFHVRVNATDGPPFQIRAVGSDQSTTLPVTVRPAPAELTWTLLDRPELEAGESATLEFRITGGAPSNDVSVGLSLRAGGRILATDQVRLAAGQAVNRTLALTFTPSDPGPLDIEVVGETSNARDATLRPADSQSARPSFTVAEPDLFTSTLRTLADSPYVTAGTLVVAAASLAGVGFVLYQRRREVHPTTPPPDAADSGSSEVAASDGATVAEGFMPRKVDRFHVERVLGEGGFGTTYLAEDSVLERPVVLKDLENVGQGEARDLLLHEAKTAANLQHGNVVVVHDVIEEEGRLLLVMEYVEGGTLDERVDGGLPVKEALPLAQDLLSGLAALHEAGIVHRDVKPSNILLAPDGTAKITDFGVAVQLDEPPGDEDAFVGTPRYMAPEQLAGEAPGPASDVYAAGALVYHMLTGEHHLGLGDRTPPPEELLERHVRLPIDDVPDELNDVLARALAEDPEDRYPDAGAFLEALSSLDPVARSGDPTTQSG